MRGTEATIKTHISVFANLEPFFSDLARPVAHCPSAHVRRTVPPELRLYEGSLLSERREGWGKARGKGLVSEARSSSVSVALPPISREIIDILDESVSVRSRFRQYAQEAAASILKKKKNSEMGLKQLK